MDGVTPRHGGHIRLTALTKQFSDVTAVDGIDLDIGAGEFFSLLGPSGCGKTTTLRMVAGFEQPTSGQILLDGSDLVAVPPHRRPVNTVFQSYALFPHLSVEDNIAYGLRWRGSVDKAERRRRVGEAVELVRLGGLEQRRPAQLSGGQQRRVALARALILRPKVLLLDEPLGALDARLRKDLQIDLATLQREVGITFVYVTHDQEEALTMSQRLAVMDAGRVVQVGTPIDVYEHPATAYVADFLGVANVLDADGDTARDGRRTVRLGSFVLDAGGEGPAGPVKLVIRPERVHVVAGEATGPNCIPAMVEQVVYVGSTTRVHVRLPGGEPLQSLTTNDGAAPDLARGHARRRHPARRRTAGAPRIAVQLHGWSADHDRLAGELTRRIREHWSADAPLGRTPAAPDVAGLAAITAAGLGVDDALRLVDEVLLANNVALDHPQFLAYIPAAPATTAALFDAVVGAWSFSGESWQEAGAAVAAENAALDWLRSLAGMPSETGGCFVSGGSAGNLSGLAVARDVWRQEHSLTGRLSVACAPSAHSSVRSAAALLDLDIVEVPGDEHDRLTAAALAGVPRDGICAVVASAGATNTGAIDELDGVASVCAERGWWLHVDAAYGGGALCVPEIAARFAGIEHADSLVIDPHKWLFTPLDCAALLYRDPAAAARTHRQSAAYLDAFGAEHVNPSDLAFHLTRRARGLPFWFALVVHGTDAFADAVRAGIGHARRAADLVRAIGPPLRLVMEPELSVVLFERDGWSRPDWDRWATEALADGLAFVAPTRWRGRDVGRLAFLHPHTDVDAVRNLLLRCRAGPGR